MPSHKTLKSVVVSLAQSFTSTLNYASGDYVMGHIVYTAWSTGATGLRLDLLSGETDSSPLLTPPVRNSLPIYVNLLPDIVERSNSSMEFIARAELVITVDPTQRRPYRHGLFESPFTCTVRIVDDRGKEYSHRIEDWWFPEKVPGKEKKRKWWKLW
ncbi:MAG: hypothetical protein JSV52_07675 [Candidatus Zixiibacteriota bacterium]|nr:MAG: hypothetical protein JSV52_07675 [candidate division Zixibacteria bacterium]